VTIDIDLLVTGGAGFIGCALTRRLIADSIKGPGSLPLQIVAFDILHPQVHPNRTRPEALHESVELVEADVCDAAGWDRLLQQVRPRKIVHLAAETGTGQSLDLPTRHTHVNVTGTATMLEALDRHVCQPEQILLASSRAVYGEGEWLDPANGQRYRPNRRDHAALESGRFQFVAPSGRPAIPVPHDSGMTYPEPVSVYGATKLTQEHVLQAWCAARSTRLTILRLQNVFGAGQSPYNLYTGIVGLFHRLAAAGQTIEVYEDGQIGRDFIPIDDVARIMARALAQPVTGHEAIDVGSGKAMTILDAAGMIALLYGAPQPRISGAFRDGDIRWAVASTERLERQLGLSAQLDFATANLQLSRWLQETGAIAAGTTSSGLALPAASPVTSR
jgi:dTDP-L-rhamnose 4-epimerase